MRWDLSIVLCNTSYVMLALSRIAVSMAGLNKSTVYLCSVCVACV